MSRMKTFLERSTERDSTKRCGFRTDRRTVEEGLVVEQVLSGLDVEVKLEHEAKGQLKIVQPCLGEAKQRGVEGVATVVVIHNLRRNHDAKCTNNTE